MNWVAELRWRPTIGDPGFMGWFTVFAYALAALLALRAARASRGGRIWWFVALLMFALCINKQLDLQSLFTDVGRVLARHEGWYEQRRKYQEWFIVVLLLGALLTGLGIRWGFAGFWRDHQLLAVGLLVLMTFIVVRAVSFHHIDMLLRRRVFDFRLSWVLELSGIFLVGWAALTEGRPQPVGPSGAKRLSRVS